MSSVSAERPFPVVPLRLAVSVTLLLCLVGGYIAARVPFAALVLPAGVALLVLGLRYPIRFFCAFVFYGSIELFLVTRLPDGLYLIARMASEVLLLMVSLGVIARVALSRGLKRTPIDLPLLAFLGICLASALWNHVESVPALLGLRILLRFSLVYYAIVQLEPDPSELRPFLWALVASLALQVGIGLLQAIDPRHLKPFFLAEAKGKLFGIEVKGGQSFWQTNIRSAIFGTMENYNGYGAFLALSLPLVYVYRKLCQGRRRFWLGVLLLAGLVALFLTGSRSSTLALAAAAMTALIQLRQRLAFMVVCLLAATLAAIVLLVAVQRQGVFQQDVAVYTNSALHRWLLLFEPGAFRAGPGTNFRLFVFQRMVTRILTHAPLLGLGIGTFGSLYSIQSMVSMYRELGLSAMLSHKFVADCNWITIYAQTGILGFVTFIAVLWKGARGRPARSREKPPINDAVRALRGGLPPFLAAYAVLAIFGPYLETRYLSFLLWMLLAVAGVVHLTGTGALETSTAGPETSTGSPITSTAVADTSTGARKL